jgi:DNA-directed RNA polymerase specialized sigma24 family protein
MVQLASWHPDHSQPMVDESNGHHRLTDGALVESCLQGDDIAWEVLLERYGCLIYSIARRVDLSSEDVADVFQSVCLAMLDNLEALKNEPNVSSWLVTVTMWQCRQLLDLGEPESEPDGDSSEWLLPDDEVGRMEQERLARQASSMADGQSERLLFSAFHEWSPDASFAGPTDRSASIVAPDQDSRSKGFMSVP